MNMTMIETFATARRVSAPLVAIASADQMATIEALKAQPAVSGFPLVQWDAVRGLMAVPGSKAGETALQKAGIKSADTIAFVDGVLAARLLVKGTIVFMLNAHRQLQSQEPAATAAAVQALSNARDELKLNFRMFVLLGPHLDLPIELQRDVVMLTHELPDEERLGATVRELYASARDAQLKRSASETAALAPLSVEVVGKAVEALSGLSAFEAEQVTAMALTEHGLDMSLVWDRKRIAIESKRGCSVYRGTQTLDELRGLDSVKARLRQHLRARTPIGVVVWIDEGADVFSNVESDTSGVKADQQRALLVEMEQQPAWRGIIAVGVPGSGKSAIARAFGNEAGVPTIMLDFGDMESKYVGESEAYLRQALQIIKAVGRGHAFFLLTANSLRGIRPQFQRRFKRGIFFFDLPTVEEREAIWRLYTERYGLVGQPLPDDDGWTGAEIEECCKAAWDTGVTLAESARYIVPVSRSRATEIEAMRREAHGRFLDASRPGVYTYAPEPMARQVRAIALPEQLVNMRES